MAESDWARRDGADGQRVEWSSSETVLAILRTIPAGCTIVLDFDETLILRNSTEAYLDHVRPRTLARLVLLVLGFVRPWRFWSGASERFVRDWFRVVAVTVAAPWSAIAWRRKASEFATDHVNGRLVEVLAASDDVEVVVATHGFAFIVRPILDRIPIQVDALAARRFWRGMSHGVDGKAPAVIASLGADRLAEAVVVTDSRRDSDLLNAAGQALLVAWPEAKYRRALQDVYLPLVYTEKVKHPGKGFFVKAILADDWLVTSLALAWTAGAPIMTAVGILLMTLAFWTIYEVGYRENDRIAEDFERDPTLRDEYFDDQTEAATVLPWVWAICFSVVGAALIGPPGVEIVSVAGATVAWIGVLAATRLLFWIYNHADKGSRAWIYLGLHLLRTFGILVFLPVSLAAALALCAQVLSRWAMYLVYRLGAAKWPGPSVAHLTRLLMFLVLGAAVSVVSPEAIVTWQSAALLAWFAIRARRGIADAVKSAGRIS